MSEIFSKIDLKFYSYVTTYNQANEYVYFFFFFGIQYILFLVIKITIPIVRKFNQKYKSFF